MASFVKQYYASASYIPSVILLQYPVDEMSMLAEWLKERRGGKIELQVPQRGAKKRLVNMVAENADKGLLLAKAKQINLETITSGLQELKDRLCLPRIPLRIEGYDISDIRGTLAVGSMVVLEKGLPRPSHYRRFRVKMVAGADDYAMIQEILRRRFKRAVIARSDSDEAISQKSSWAVMPDLVLIDGGKGHLATALEARRESGVDFIPMASLAKEAEDVFIPGKPDPVDIAKDSPALHILQRVRDEAHRFAISYHQKLRSKRGIASILDDIPGIGPKRRKALLKKFGSIEAIREASIEEISQVERIPLTLAQRVKQYL
jgi:excinuclease ABC subunit C